MERVFLIILAIELDRVTPLERCDEGNALGQQGIVILACNHEFSIPVASPDCIEFSFK
jgi:hypothetical protein